MELAAVIAGLAVLAVAAYGIDLRWHPRARCQACKRRKGGWNRGSSPRRYDLCRRCGGTRRRIRAGATLVRPDLKPEKAKNKRKKKGKGSR